MVKDEDIAHLRALAWAALILATIALTVALIALDT